MMSASVHALQITGAMSTLQCRRDAIQVTARHWRKALAQCNGARHERNAMQNTVAKHGTSRAQRTVELLQCVHTRVVRSVISNSNRCFL